MGNSATKAKNKYNDSNYDRIPLVVSKGRKDEIDTFIKSVCPDKSRNQFINEAIDERMERIQRKREASMPFVPPPGEECPKDCKKRCTMIPAAEDGKPVVEIPLCTLYGKEIVDNKKCVECLQSIK